MLWQKRMFNGKLVYVDIFDGVEENSKLRHFHSSLKLANYVLGLAKNNKISRDLVRNRKNIEKKCENLMECLVAANTSLCYAETDCEEVGMAYELRAHWFLQFKQYSLCLADIELAKLNNYPLALRSFLDENKEKCLEIMADHCDDAQPIDGPKLSLPANAKIPCFAQCLEIKQSKQFGKHIITNRNLEIGQTVIIEDAFCIASSNAQNYLQCANCFERKANLIPCKNCAAIMFCSQKCYDIGHDKFHAFECGKDGVHSNWEASRRVVLQTVIHAIKLFPNISALMAAVEKFNEGEIPTDADPSIRAYMQFFELSQSIKHTMITTDVMLISYTKSMHEEITLDAAYKSTFRTLEASRFLAHLILHHVYIIDANVFDAISYLHGICTTELGYNIEHLSGVKYAMGIYLNSSRLNHSCQPNIVRIFMENKLVCKVIRPIKPGEQLFVTYLNSINLLLPTIDRLEKLAEHFYFECKCISCTSNNNNHPLILGASVNLDVSICRLLGIIEGTPLIVSKNIMVKLERSAVKYLQSNAHLHPTLATLKIQFLLTQIWNNLGR